MILITPRSVNSKWVYMEVGAAWIENKTIIPLTQFVRIEDLPELITNTQARSIETEQEKLNLVYEIVAKKGVSAPVKISLEFIMDKIGLAKSQMEKELYQPNLFIGVGKGGAVCAGLFSAHFGQQPLKVVDCHFDGKGEHVIKIDASSLKRQEISGKNILVIEWARRSGSTYRQIKETINSMNPASLHSYAMFWTGSKNPPDYFAQQTENVPNNPWSLY